MKRNKDMKRLKSVHYADEKNSDPDMMKEDEEDLNMSLGDD